MKNETEKTPSPSARLTRQALRRLEEKGFLYVLVSGLSRDLRPDYMEPRFLILTPIRALSEDPEQKGIYEPINSEILTRWADAPDEGVEVFIAEAV